MEETRGRRRCVERRWRRRGGEGNAYRLEAIRIALAGETEEGDDDQLPGVAAPDCAPVIDAVVE